jgi:hypothetical protein
MASEPPDPFAGPGWPRFTPEQIEGGRRYGFDLENVIDGSAFIQSLIAELEGRQPPPAGPAS